jgi:hypothetical protein
MEDLPTITALVPVFQRVVPARRELALALAGLQEKLDAAQILGP